MPHLSPLGRYGLAAVAVLLLEVAATRYIGSNVAVRPLVAGYVFPAVMVLVWLVLAAEAWTAEEESAPETGDGQGELKQLAQVAVAAALLTLLAALTAPDNAAGAPPALALTWLYFAAFGAVTVAVAPVVRRGRKR